MAPVTLLLIVAVAVAAASSVAAELPRLEQSPKADGSLTILAVGDWGRHGEFNQSRVAAQVYMYLRVLLHHAELHTSTLLICYYDSR